MADQNHGPDFEQALQFIYAKVRDLVRAEMSSQHGTIWRGGKWLGEGIWIDNTSVKVDANHRLTVGTVGTGSLPVATTGSPGIVQIGSGISVTGGVISTVNNGTVTSIGLTGPGIFTISGSPVTGAGTISIALATQTANTVWAGPTSGGAAAPTFRALVAADIPALDAGKITSGTLAQARGGTGKDTSGATDGQLLIGKTSDHSLNLATLTAGSGITITNGAGSITVAASGGGTGTVTSVDMSVPSFLTISGNPITTSGTLALGLANQSANTVFAGPSSGGAAAPTFRSLVAADIPNLAASKITSGQLAQAQGGTGIDTSGATDGQLLIGQSSDHSLGLATLTAGSGITITNSGHGITVAASGSGGGGTALTLIADTLVAGSSVASITFSSIPGTYKHLRVVLSGQSTASTDNVSVQMQVNGDTGSTQYYFEGLRSDSTSAFGDEGIAVSAATVMTISGATSSTGMASGGEIVIPDYASTTFHKHWVSVGNLMRAESSTNIYVWHHSGEWKSTAAITSLLFKLASGNFAVGTRISLYGMS